jgi:tRNA nucleotidyltransferase/poly(A) polymerase
MTNAPAVLLAGHPRAPLLAAIGGCAAAAGYRTAAVGGFVRDLLLGIISQDIDIAVEGDAIACARLLADRLGGAVAKTSRFGTALLMVDNTRIDLATARTESYSRPGALPEVSPGTLADDLWRRDFTVNAIALEIGPGRRGRLLDPTGGREDLAAKIIRILHPGSFRDDPTRMLRAVRLAHRLKFTLDAVTAERLREAVAGRWWQTVGPHRLGRELRLLFSENDLPGLCRSLDAWNLFRPLFAAIPTAAILTALGRVNGAAAMFENGGLAFDRPAVAALVIGGRAGDLLDSGNLAQPWASRLPALRSLLAAPAENHRLAAALRDIPPAVLAYLWIMCQNEEERLRLKPALDSVRHTRPNRGGPANPERTAASPYKEDK